jgi:predicted neuraminidase
MLRVVLFLLLSSAIIAQPSASAQEEQAKKPLGSEAIVKQEFIYEAAPFPSCHASTIAETPHGLVCAWFGGTQEGHADVEIWLSRFENDSWSKPEKVADGAMDDGKRHPCWNPVLVSREKQLTLFYKVGPSPSTWWGMKIDSTDGGRSWGEPMRLADDYLGPIKNKPLRLADGTIVCGSSTEHRGWWPHFEIFDVHNKPLARVEPEQRKDTPQAIQPALLQLADDTLVALCRPRLPGRTIETRSRDGGQSWSVPEATGLPNPGSGIDAVTLRDGRHLMIYNHTIVGRSPLNVALAADDQLAWQAAVALETAPGEYSYPAMIETADGRVHITYTWKRTKIRHVVLDPARLEGVSFTEGRWPK